MLVTSFISKANQTIPEQPPVNIPNKVSTLVLPNRAVGSTTTIGAEVIFRSIQNNGLNPVYIAIGSEASPVNYSYLLNGASAAGNGGQSLTLVTCESVYAWCDAGTSVISVHEVVNPVQGINQ